MDAVKLILPKVKKDYPDIRPTVRSGSYYRTIREMKRIARQYAGDLKPYAARLSLPEFYLMLRGLEYRRDIPGVETLVRMRYAVSPEWQYWRDCDDKTMIAMAYAILNKIKYRIVVCGKGNEPHHVYPEFKMRGGWMPFDATFPPDAGHKNVSYMGRRLYAEKFREVFY